VKHTCTKKCLDYWQLIGKENYDLCNDLAPNLVIFCRFYLQLVPPHLLRNRMTTWWSWTAIRWRSSTLLPVAWGHGIPKTHQNTKYPNTQFPNQSTPGSQKLVLENPLPEPCQTWFPKHLLQNRFPKPGSARSTHSATAVRAKIDGEILQNIPAHGWISICICIFICIYNSMAVKSRCTQLVPSICGKFLLGHTKRFKMAWSDFAVWLRKLCQFLRNPKTLLQQADFSMTISLGLTWCAASMAKARVAVCEGGLASSPLLFCWIAHKFTSKEAKAERKQVSSVKVLCQVLFKWFVEGHFPGCSD